MQVWNDGQSIAKVGWMRIWAECFDFEDPNQKPPKTIVWTLKRKLGKTVTYNTAQGALVRARRYDTNKLLELTA